MRIYIDESGSFISGTAPSRICCIAALVVPEIIGSTLLSEYEGLRGSWTSEPEVKGSSLTDEQTAAALKLLGTYDVVVAIVAFDVGHHSQAQIQAFQQEQGEAFLASLTPQHNANAHRWARSLREEWIRLSPQLVAQLYTLILTIEDVVRFVPNYYAQRRPAELGRFEWVIDPKDGFLPQMYARFWDDLADARVGLKMRIGQKPAGFRGFRS